MKNVAAFQNNPFSVGMDSRAFHISGMNGFYFAPLDLGQINTKKATPSHPLLNAQRMKLNNRNSMLSFFT